MSKITIAFGPDSVVPSATRSQPDMGRYGQSSVWPTITSGTMFLWGTEALGEGEVRADDPVTITGTLVFSNADVETLRLPDLVKMEEPKND